MFLSFCVLNDFFRFSKFFGFWVFLVHRTVVSVLLSASVERCFVSLMQDFFMICWSSQLNLWQMYVFFVIRKKLCKIVIKKNYIPGTRCFMDKKYVIHAFYWGNIFVKTFFCVKCVPNSISAVWTGDFCSYSVSIILAYLLTFSCFLLFKWFFLSF